MYNVERNATDQFSFFSHRCIKNSVYLSVLETMEDLFLVFLLVDSLPLYCLLIASGAYAKNIIDLFNL